MSYSVHKMKKYKFFYGGIFSNWYLSYFVVDGISFNSGEQYMMYKKATTFKDDETAKKIMAEKSPKKQKELGREVKNYVPEIWNELRYDLVKKGLREKFNQNAELKSKLLFYRGCQFVEASPIDRIWGIGFGEWGAIKNIDNWGENLLGKILTELSNEIIS